MLFTLLLLWSLCKKILLLGDDHTQDLGSSTLMETRFGVDNAAASRSSSPIRFSEWVSSFER